MRQSTACYFRRRPALLLALLLPLVAVGRADEQLLELPKLPDVPDVSLPVPDEQQHSKEKLTAAHHALSGAGHASLKKKSGAAEKQSDYEKDRGFYFVKAYGWDREKKNDRASAHGQLLEADKSAKFQKQGGLLHKKAEHGASVAYDRTLYTPQVDYLESNDHEEAYAPVQPNFNKVRQLLGGNGGGGIGGGYHHQPQHPPGPVHQPMLGTHMPGHDYRYRVQYKPKAPVESFNKGYHGGNENYKNRLNPHLTSLINLGQSGYQKHGLYGGGVGGGGGDGEGIGGNYGHQEYQEPATYQPNKPLQFGQHRPDAFQPPHQPQPAPYHRLEEEDGSAAGYEAAGDEEEDEEGKYYYDQPMSRFDLARLRQGHRKFDAVDNQLHEQHGQRRFGQERPAKFEPRRRYDLYRGSHYYS